MIKQDREHTEIVGKRSTILAEFGTLVHGLRTHFTEEELRESFNRGLKTEKEINAEMDEKIKNFIHDLIEKLKED